MNILHIAAHLGGGAGKAISGIALQGQRQFQDTHRILLLQEPEKDGYVQACLNGGVKIDVWAGDRSQLAWADVVVVSWWNHPAMARFLYELPPLSAAMVLWSHVNGRHYPYLPFPLADAFDAVLFTSPYSLENSAWTEEERLRIRERSQIVYGMGQFYPRQFIPKESYVNQENFVIGYIGTLNYGKLHPDFIDYCQAVCNRTSSAQFIMAGDHDQQLENDVRRAGLAERFSFPGFVSDASALMRSFDVFGYLLNPSHYGTTENVLLEAMACGVPVVALRQNVEQYIIPNTAGCLAKDPQQYGDIMACLRGDPACREKLGRQGRAYVQETYCTENNTAAFHNACQSAIDRPKGQHSFSCMGETPWQWFLFCAGAENRRLFEEINVGCRSQDPQEQARAVALLRDCPPIFREQRKSSLRHFAATYPKDVSLQLLNKKMEESNNGRNQTELRYKAAEII